MSVRTAVYGKGGIGKSTVSANLSFCLAGKGLRTLHVGCDPKHDSARPLVHGDLETVIDYTARTPPSRRRAEDIVVEGANGVLCVEAGGPEPGVGCAGKGIMTMFRTLEALGIDDAEATVYDVLGDVVCGGFAVPMRKGFADCIIIVTSGEPMSLYAANNIMRGEKGFEEGKGKVAGLVLNRRGTKLEEDLVRRFSEATGVPVIADIPRSELFQDAERHRMTVCEVFPRSREAAIFHDLADRVVSIGEGSIGTFSPRPLTDGQMDLLLLGEDVGMGGYSKPGNVDQNAPMRHVPRRRIGKGPIGALIECSKVTDIPTVIHGTGSCAFTMMNEATERKLDSVGAGCSKAPSQDMVSCSSMRPSDGIRGGVGILADSLEGLIDEGNDDIMVVTTCISDMIGDDIGSLVDSMESSHPGVRIRVIDSAGMDSGGDGHMDALRKLSELIECPSGTDADTVALVDDTFILLNKGRNREFAYGLLSMMGMRPAPGFLDNCDSDDIRELGRASVAVLGDLNHHNIELKDVLESKGIRFIGSPLPMGYHETVGWLTELGDITDRRDRAASAVSKIEGSYRECLNRNIPRLTGRRVCILSDDADSVTWMAWTLADVKGLDLSVHTVRIEGPLDIPQSPVSHRDAGSARKTVIEGGYDIVIGTDRLTDGIGTMTMRPPDTCISHRASMLLMENLANVLESDGTLAWRTWGGADAQ
ncbi:MAG: nitrogenase component 1 [Candidatus Methanomethylophilaceae archaeon]